METRSARFGLLSLLLALAACGGTQDPVQLTNEGYDALGKADHGGALERFQAALPGLEPGSSEYERAKMGEIEALIAVDPERAKDTMLGLGDGADADQYATVGSKLTSAGRFLEAIAVLDAGMKRYSESPKLKAMLDQVTAEAQKQGDSGALKALEGLGYL